MRRVHFPWSYPTRCGKATCVCGIIFRLRRRRCWLIQANEEELFLLFLSSCLSSHATIKVQHSLVQYMAVGDFSLLLLSQLFNFRESLSLSLFCNEFREVRRKRRRRLQETKRHDKWFPQKYRPFLFSCLITLEEEEEEEEEVGDFWKTQ